MAAPIPRTVAHYALHDPRHATGGVEAFARDLRAIFEDVVFMTPASRDEARVARERLPVVCDNHWVRDWPARIPVIGLQHGVALVKLRATRRRVDLDLAFRQWLASRRPSTLWVATAPWVGRAFGQLHGNAARHVVPPMVDHERFDGRLASRGSRLVLHDARDPHKGSGLVPVLRDAFPAWRFEGLDCSPAEVPDRLRAAAAFVHLSAYEGNSLVCQEAMAMDLPCLFTDVGLFRDPIEADVVCIPKRVAFGPRGGLVDAVGGFLASVGRRRFRPRAWSLEHAGREASAAAWRRVLAEFDALAWG